MLATSRLFMCIVVLALAVTPAMALTQQDFDGGGSPFGAFGDATAPVAGGPTGAFGRLTPAANSQFGRIAFDQADAGNGYTKVAATFDFRAIPGGGQADGLSVVLLPTTGPDAQGTSGDFSLTGAAEFGRHNGGLGIGFNIHQGGSDISNNSLYLSHDGGSVAQVAAPFDISTSDFHRARLTMTPSPLGGSSVSLVLTQDINGAAGAPQTVFDDVHVPGLNAYDYRVGYAARTGGQNADQQIDNVTVRSLLAPDATVQDFDNPGTGFGVFGAASAPVAGGPTGNFGQLTPATNSVGGRIGFDQTAADDRFNSIVGRFDFRAIPGNGQADGLSMMLVPTTGVNGQGASGDFSHIGAAEFGFINGGLGIGLNIHQGGSDISNNSVYISYDGVTQTQVAAPFDMSTSEFHRALYEINFLPGGGGALLSLAFVENIHGVNGASPVVTDLLIPGLTPYEFRVGFAARTGGENADQQIDNVFVYTTQVPEPATALLAGLGGLALLRRRR